MTATQCAQIDAIVPWYLNGTASTEDRALVESHLAGCANCRRRVSTEQRIVTQLRTGLADETPDAAQAWTRFERSIGPATEGSSRPSRHLRWIIGAQAAAIVFFAVAFVQLLSDRRGEPRYQTVTTPAPAVAQGRVLLRIAASSELSPQRVAQLAHDLGAVVTDGPSSQGVFTLELLPDRVRAQTIARLRSTSGILLVEPVSNPTR
jgi:anti-sigma factor RsiW